MKPDILLLLGFGTERQDAGWDPGVIDFSLAEMERCVRDRSDAQRFRGRRGDESVAQEVQIEAKRDVGIMKTRTRELTTVITCLSLSRGSLTVGTDIDDHRRDQT